MAGSLADNAWVQLNIGGTVFETTRQTLCRDPESFLARLVSEDSGLASRKDKNGAYVVDRDPDNFAFILRYLRTGFLKVPDGVALEELVEEADFYNLPALVKLIEDTKFHKRRVEFVVVVRHVNRRVVELAVSETGNDYEILSELRSKGLDVKDDAGSYYVFEAEDLAYASKSMPTWEVIYAKLRSVLLGNGFKLEKHESKSNKWTFVRVLNP